MDVITSVEPIESSTQSSSSNSSNSNRWSIQSLSSQPIRILARKITAHWIIRETVLLFRLAVPIIFTLIFQQTLLLISLVFVGHINREDYESESLHLDAAVLAGSFVNITGFSVGIGISTASDTLSAQTHGFGNYKQVGVILQRGLLIAFLLCIFITCVWLNTESILLLLQQDPCIAKYSAQYVNIYIVALPPILLYTLLQKYLQTQNIVWPFVISGLVTNIVSAVFNAVFIFGFNFGLRGASAALVIANIFQPFAVIVYVKIRKLHTKTWGGWSFDSLRCWLQYLKLGIPGMLMICIEWISFEIAAIVLGTINEVELAVHGIVLVYMSFVFMVPLGIGISVSFRVGNELGAGNPQRAKRAAYVAISITVINAIIIIGITQAIKNSFGQFFNAEEEVNHKLKYLLNFITYSGFFIGDQAQAVLSGILRGAGHQFRGAIINFIAFYVFGLPIGITLAIVIDMGVVGMWIGLTIAVYVQSVSSLILILCMNWKKEARLAMERGNSAKERSNGTIGDHPLENPSTVLTRYLPLKQDDIADGITDITATMIIKESDVDNKCNDVNQNDAHSNHSDADSNHSDAHSNHSDADSNHNDAHSNHSDAHSNHSDAHSNHSDADSNHSDGGSDDGSTDLLQRNDNQLSKFGQFLMMLKSHSKLIINHSILLTVSLITLTLAGIGSCYHPPDYIYNGNYSECSINETMLY